jgi:integrase
MARTVRDAKLETPAARDGLKPRAKPYWRIIIPQALHLGYRRRRRGAPGWWVERRYVRRDGPGSPYRVKTIGLADDYQSANGDTVLSYAQAQQRALERQNAVAGTRGPLTIAQVIEVYLEFLETDRKSAGDARYRANAFILPRLGKIEVEALTTDTIRRWLIEVAAEAPRLRTRKGKEQRHADMGEDDESKRRRRSTANRTLTVLKAALNHAWREDDAGGPMRSKVRSDDAWRRVKPFKKVEAARVRYLSVAEAKRLINASDPDFRQLVLAALATGARYGELAALCVSDFNADAGTVHVRTSKSGTGRHIVLTDEGAAHFAGLCAGRAGGETLLLKSNGQPWEKSHQARPMADALARAKIAPPISFHGLRHTYASLAIMNGAPLLVVAKNLGHSGTVMVEKHYGHLADSYVADAIRAAAPRFGAGKRGNVAPLRAKGA